MKAQRIAIAVTVVNLFLMSILLTRLQPAMAQQKPAPAILRGEGLEIIDKSGRTRASISLQPPVEVDGKKYPETILFRLIAPNGKPMVKIGATVTGSGVTLIDGADEGILMRSDYDETYFRMYQKGKEKLLKPGDK